MRKVHLEDKKEQKTQMRGDKNQLDDILDTVDTMAKSNNGADVLMEILEMKIF